MSYFALDSGSISRDTDLGHVNLRVTDLDRAVRFYRDVLGFHITQRDAESAFHEIVAELATRRSRET